MLTDRLRLRFSLKSWFVLILGIAIGFSLNLPLRQFFARFMQRPSVATTSNRFFVITEKPAGSTSVRSLPITGNDTVLDVVTRVGGIANPNSTTVSIVRPPANGVGVETTLTVDWAKVASRDPAATNYQLFAGDRVHVSPKPVSAAAQ